jgi:hypothetical protein
MLSGDIFGVNNAGFDQRDILMFREPLIIFASKPTLLSAENSIFKTFLL